MLINRFLNEIMVQAVLTDIRVVGHQLQLSLREVGCFTVGDYVHPFSLRRVPLEEAVWAELELNWRKSVQQYPTRRLSTVYEVIQVEAPVGMAKSRCYTLRQLQQSLLSNPRCEEHQRFVEHMFTYLIEHPPSGRKPYSIGTLREHLHHHPNVNSRHRPTIDSILAVLEEGWPEELPSLPKDKTPKVRLPSPLPELFFRGHYSQMARWKIAPKGSIVDLDDAVVQAVQSGQKEIAVKGALRYVRQRTASELIHEKMILLDIEKPLFGTEEEAITWTATLEYKAGDDFIPRLFSVYDLPPLVNGFPAKKCASEEDLVHQVAEHIRKSRASVFAAYHVPFDAIQLREAGRFAIGDDNEEPKKVSTLPFFERIGIKGMDVLDLLRWARIQYDYLPNRKLACVAQHLLGKDAFHKQITYDQQRQLERICQGMDPAEAKKEVQEMVQRRSAAEIIASYVSGDVQVLKEMVSSSPFLHAVEDVSFLSQQFTIDFFLLMHDAKRIQDFLERRFFEKVGVFREAIFPHLAVFMNYEQRVKDQLMKTVENNFTERKEGLVDNLAKVYLPLGRALRQDMGWFFPEAKELFRYIDQYADDPQRHFFLARYEDALAEWMWKDYAAYLYEDGKLRKMFTGKNLEQFKRVAQALAKTLIRSGLEEKLNKGAVAQRDLRQAFQEYDYAKEVGIDFYDFHWQFRQWSRVRQKNRILWGAWEAGWETYEMRLREFCTGIQNYFKKNKIEVIRAQHRYLYVTGNINALYQKDSPVIPVDRIERAYLTAEAVYYPQHGFWNSFKREDKPTHHLNILEMDMVGEFLGEVIRGNQEKAVREVWEWLDAAGSRNISKKDLVWQTASTRKYRAYEDGQEIHFYDWHPREESRIKVLKGKEFVMKREFDGARHYLMEPYCQGRDIVHRKRLIMEVDAFVPDWEMYQQRMAERAEILVRPLLGKESKLFVQDALNSEPPRTLAHYLRPLESERQLLLFSKQQY